MLFAEHGTSSAAQIKAFEDTWRWDEAAAQAYEETVEQGGEVAQAMRAFRTLLGTSDMLAYLAIMAPRLIELRRVLKASGSLYLHCDPAASHYLKIVLDSIFEPKNFRNEISWKRTSAHNDAHRFGRIHDILLYYAKDARKAIFNRLYTPYDQSYLDAEWRQDESGRWYKLENLTAPLRGSKGQFDFHGRTPGKNRMWRFTPEGMEKLWDAGRVRTDANGIPLRRAHITYLDEMPGVPLQDWWGDILRVGNTAKERLGYPTQKPEALLERIIAASCNEGDTVLDPFCGCGTAVAVAQRLQRRWVGIDITHLAVNLIRHRMRDAYGDEIEQTYEVIGEPVTLDDAEELAKQDPYQFQWWALGIVGARPAEQKKGADKGIDGRIYFHDEGRGGKTKQIVLSVKAGNVHRSHIHELRGVIDREDAQIGVLISFEESTRPMREEAASAGFYDSPWGKHPRLQIITVEQLLDGKQIDYPHVTGVTFKKAPKAQGPESEALTLDL